VRQILAAITTDRGAVVVGQRGTGRTTLVELVTRQLPASRYAAVRTTATEAARAIPYGLFSHLFPVTGDPALVPGRVRSELLRRCQSRTPLLVVEDAHRADDRSASTLLGLAHDGHIRLMVTMVPDASTPDAIVALWKDRHLLRVDLPPLDAAETAELMRVMLGEAVASTTAQLVHQWTGGNPRLVTELVRHGRSTGRLRHERGLWWWRGPLSVPAHLAELLVPESSRFTAAHRDALAAVATGERLPLELIDRIAPDAVEELEDIALLRTTGAGSSVCVEFRHPMLREVIISRLSPARRRRVALALVDAAGDCGATDPVAVDRWRVAAGVPVSSAVLEEMARHTRPHDPEQALRLARVAFGHRRSSRAAVVLADALAETGAGREVPSVLQQAMVSEDSAAGRVELSVALVLHRCWDDRDPDSALAGLEAVRAAAPATAYPVVDAAEALLLLLSKRPTEALLVAGRLPGSRRCRVVRMVALALIGRTGEAAHEGAAVLADAGHDAAPDAAGLTMALLSLVGLWRDGQATMPVTDPILGRWPRPPGQVPGTGLQAVDWPLLSGYAKLLQGDHPGAIEALREAVGQQADGWRPLSSEASAWLAVSLAAAGQPDDAQRVLDTHPPDRLAIFPGLGPWADGMVAAARGDLPAARDLLEEAVAAAHAAGCVSVELQYLTWAARLARAAHPADLAERITGCLPQVEAERLGAEARGEAALLCGDRAGLLASAGSLAGMGLTRSAWRLAEAAVAVMPKRDKDYGTAIALAAKLRATLGIPAGDPASPALTARENEIASLVAAGMSNQDIASRLVVSSRTVESHLVRVYRKLGIGSRRELREHWFGATGLSTAPPR
jgi:DNA-binding CsgD family transcriptional regulator